MRFQSDCREGQADIVSTNSGQYSDFIEQYQTLDTLKILVPVR